MIALVGDVDVAQGVGCDAPGMVELAVYDIDFDQAGGLVIDRVVVCPANDVGP